MAEVTPLKVNLQELDLRTGAAASESTMQKVGSSVNFWNTNYEGARYWVINGPYSITPVPDNGVDGFVGVPVDMEIFGVLVGTLAAGSSGTTEFDIVKYPAGGGSPVTIFTQRPIIPFSSTHPAFVQVETLPSYSIVRQTAGTTAPTLVSTSLDKGDILGLNFINKQSGGQGATVAVFLRPRN
jgi:hypothetical protein